MSNHKQNIREHIENVLAHQPFTTSVIRKKFKNVNRATVNNAVAELAKEGFIKNTRMLGRAKVYIKTDAGPNDDLGARGNVQKVLRARKETLVAQREGYEKGMMRCDEQIQAIEDALEVL